MTAFLTFPPFERRIASESRAPRSTACSMKLSLQDFSATAWKLPAITRRVALRGAGRREFVRF
ncbi:hypothetical protein BSU04_08255 [Caballeronia sordidicola]|uniref:Uncharacterized protein n=1 Tax=Caballeronia sordidicola TaxID=196367 RepID=A0A226X6U9_CABSO|nr:hypothetical protein BSU04_08255 [Caballeronia sordidicola]